MSKLHEPAKQRLVDSVVYDGVILTEVFDSLLEKASENKPDTAQYVHMFIDENDEFVEGTYVPEIWFVLRKVIDEDEDDKAT